LEDWKKEAIDWVAERIDLFVDLLPFVRIYTVKWFKRKSNPEGGWLAVSYSPYVFHATFYVYSGVLDEVPVVDGERVLSDGWKRYVDYGIAHEVGHLLTWDLYGDEEKKEKTASMIGSIIANLVWKLEGK